jgi:hypothetical protein
MNTTKVKYLQIIEISRMFLNVATFSVTILDKKKIDFFKDLVMPDILMST